MRSITAEQVRKGDKIRVTGQFEVKNVVPGLYGPVFQHVDEDGLEWEFVPSKSTRSITLMSRDITVPRDAEVAVWIRNGERYSAVRNEEGHWDHVGGFTHIRTDDFQEYLRSNAEDAQFFEEIS